MSQSQRDRLSHWRLAEVLERFRGLRIVPTAESALTLAGNISFQVVGRRRLRVDDAYDVRFCIPDRFPRACATVFETGGRIPANFHKLTDGSLCLGAPSAIQLKLAGSPSLIGLIELLVVPYLAGYSHFEKHGTMPFGELEHGVKGLRLHFASLFGVSNPLAAPRFAALGSLRRRVANKRDCPCESGKRLGRCHNDRMNALRDSLGRQWLRQQVAVLAQSEQ